jgi:hypothetical protein
MLFHYKSLDLFSLYNKKTTIKTQKQRENEVLLSYGS